MSTHGTPTGDQKFDTLIEREDQIRFEQLRKDVANRLGKACSHLEKADFEALVDRITGVQIRGERKSR